ncbi:MULTISPECIES: tripartite tricarboxylate transporter substrate-binding protein [unclassified Polaromonas]|uniref:tripartite tricarboxylate transporter substrate-binding protein n=1 Tax=unclassified Polaromonas TaxID=2638319 RepID=UPI000F08DC95|nr:MULTISPECIES: tripartite tricarboxylate transporter substrate-binding protein [unclassified Polaromonas]AYQ30087.1 tripartite tricarboxylate transporter substrate binding protein [Polaromonas sp. SP1]QGJ18798.1 tripartite tricarboxylate transporter substrate binding protein [Polaromonas sp. Pch-P]
MPTIQRRKLLGGFAGLGVATLGGMAAPAWAQPAPKKLAPKLRIVIPAMTRTALDEAGRALGDALVGQGLADEIEYENKEGAGGTAGLAWYVQKYNADPTTFFMGDSNLVGSLALQKPAVDLTRVKPVARLVSDYPVVVVAAASPIKTINELVERLRGNPKLMPMAIGAVGGADHVFAGLLAKAAGNRPEDAVYLPFTRNFELVDAVTGGKAAIGIAGYSTFSAELASGKLRAVGVAAKKTAYGVRSVREQGVDVDITSWRAVFTGQGVPAARQAEMVEAVKASLAYELWKKTLKQAYWEQSWLSGPDLANFIDFDSKTTQLMVQLLKLKA